jgi:hypothetical protein
MKSGKDSWENSVNKIDKAQWRRAARTRGKKMTWRERDQTARGQAGRSNGFLVLFGVEIRGITGVIR